MEVELSEIKFGSHICSIYKYPREKIFLTILFIIHGLNANERCFYAADSDSCEQLVGEFLNKKFDINKYIKSGQMVMSDSKLIYLKDELLDIDEMIKKCKEVEKKSLADGFKGVRFCGELPLVSDKTIDGKIVVDYESLVDKYLTNSKSVAMCHYNEARYDQEVLTKLVKHHKYLAIYGSLYRNDAYPYSQAQDESNDYESLISSIVEG
jgi:hypothetical protein